MSQSGLYALLAVGLLAGCTFLPQGGPKYDELVDRPDKSAVATTDYELVRINAIVAEETRIDTSQSLSANFVSAPEIDPGLLRRGDVLSVSVWEPVGMGLFQAAGGRESMSKLVIDERGELFVPFVGTIKAAGLEVRQLRTRIEQQLAKQTPNPQVLVVRETSLGRAVTIQGDVKNPGRYQLDDGLTRLLPLLAVASPTISRAGITDLMVRRGNAVGEVWLDEVYDNPAYDIALAPDDVIVVRQKPANFNALGVVNQPGRVVSDRRDLSLLRALSLVGSLDDDRADVTGVFVFRVEQAPVIERLAQTDQLESVRVNRQPARQFVYLLDMSKGNSIFFADRFQVREGDTVYVSNAPADDWRKLLSVVVPTVTLPRAATPSPALVGP